MIERITTFVTFKELIIDSYNSDDNQTLFPQDYELYITVVADVVGASETGNNNTNQSPAPPVQVFTTTASNILEWSVAETITESVLPGSP